MKVTKCDQCDKDLTRTGRQPAFRLTLSSEEIPHDTNIINAVRVFPEIRRDFHFCNLACLRNWLT